QTEKTEMRTDVDDDHSRSQAPQQEQAHVILEEPVAPDLGRHGLRQNDIKTAAPECFRGSSVANADFEEQLGIHDLPRMTCEATDSTPAGSLHGASQTLLCLLTAHNHQANRR